MARKTSTDKDTDTIVFETVSELHRGIADIITAREDIAADWYQNPQNYDAKKAFLLMGNNKDLERLIKYDKRKLVRQLDLLARFLDRVVEKLMDERAKPGLSEEQAADLTKLYNECIEIRVLTAPLPSDNKLKIMDGKSIRAGLGKVSELYQECRGKGPSVAHGISLSLMQVA